MPDRTSTFIQLANEAGRSITGTYKNWTNFLTTASRLYKYPYHEQLMIHAQRPDATACATYDLWNNTMRRYVRRGARSIALLDTSGETVRLKYVFDVSDTGERANSRPLEQWKLGAQHEQPVMDMLEREYGASAANSLVRQIEDAAGRMAEDYWQDHRRDLLGIVDDSFLEEYDELNTQLSFRRAAETSIAYMIMARCGLNPDEHFSGEEFFNVYDWNTQDAVTALGTAVSECSEQVLRRIERTIRDYERSQNHEIHSERRLPDSRPDAERTAGDAGQVRQDAEEVSAGTPSGAVEPDASERDAGYTSEGDRYGGEQTDRTDDARDDENSGPDGEPEGTEPAPLDTADEQPESSDRGNDSERADLQLSFLGADLEISLFHSEAEQIHRIDQAESANHAPFAFSASQEEIDHLLRLGGNADSARMVIAAEFMKQKPLEEHAEFLKHTFRGGNGIRIGKRSLSAWYTEDGIRMANGKSAKDAARAQIISWPDAAKRINELLDAGQYATNVELTEAPGYERKQLAQSILYLRQDFSDSAQEHGMLPSLEQILGGGYPEEIARLADKLSDRAFRNPLIHEMERFISAYQADRSLLRFHFHRPREILDRLNGLNLPTKEFSSQMTEIPWINEFITEDEISSALTFGGSIEGAKGRVHDYFIQPHTPQEQIAFLKREYGTGGRSHALSGSTGSWIDYDSKGIRLRKNGCPEVMLSWNEVARRTNNLVHRSDYFTEQEKAGREAIEAAHYDPDDIHPDLIREELARRGIVNGEIVDEETNFNTPFIRQVMDDAELASETGVNTQEPEAETVQPASCPYAVGDIVYLEDTPFEITEIGLFDVHLRDPAMTFPILRAESREAFERLLAQDDRNVRFLPEKQEAEPSVPPPIASNFRITDDHLGEGGPKAKFRMNMDAIRHLKTLETENRMASPEEQEILSRYVGWGGLADAFDNSKSAWASEYRELKSILTPEEYDAARASTLNAHYTSPTVIRSIYEAVGRMGFQTGNILEPSMGIGNFFGLLPDEMKNSRLYGVELDSITGRIARQLYPKAEITIAGFETTDRRDFFDLAIGNVPFGQYQVDDKAYNRLGFSIHDYFFAKTLDQVRPGGVIVFVTSRYTLDKQSPEVRKYIAQRAELLGAIRLPNNSFRANAGTDVVSDIIFLQKRDRPIDIEPDWVYLGQNTDGYAINSYFIDHPEMVLGRQTSESTQYGRQDFTVAPIEGAELSELLHQAVQNIRGTYEEAELPDLGESENIDTSIPADPNVKNYSYTVVNGEVYYRENSRMVRPELNQTAQERIKGLVTLRDCVHRLIDKQLNDASDDTISKSQEELNSLYDSFSEKYGLINDRANRLAFSDDSSYYLLSSLEILNDDGGLKRKADMFTKRTIRQQRSIEHVDTAAEALAVSIGERAKVDLPFMSRLSGKSEEQLVSDLTGVIFRMPGTENQYAAADEYLSGNVREKLRAARMAAKADPTFAVNVSALEAAQPKDLDASEIDVRLGTTWVDKEYVQQFMHELLDTPYYQRRAIQVNYSPYTAEWNITGKSAVSYSDVAANVTYGTDRANAYKILEDTLNLRDVRIYDTIQDADGKERRVLNQKETTLAQQKQQAIKDAFWDWIWQNPTRRQTLVEQYNERFNAIRPREYDGSHIVFSGMNPEITLREHQRNAVAHVLYGGNTLLAHQVGAGKTFEMVAAAMESKRLGLCQKSMFVVPNHLTEQWASEFLRLYPSANILVTTKKDFEKNNRRRFCSRIATGDYDAVIIGHSQFEKIPISQERQERLIRDQIDEITAGINELKNNRGEQFTVKQLERTRKQLEVRLRKLQAEEKKDDVVTFEQLGVDRLYVDEAHSYKNLFLFTKMRNVAGLSTSEAQKSSDMFLKCRYLDELTGGRGIVFATGTPVSNSMTELYTMQRYLQYGALQRNSMTHFDCWASTFGETTTAIELAPEGTGYRARTRFAKFFNLPELMTLFKEVADIKTADQLHLPTPEAKYETVVVSPSGYQQQMVQALSERASAIHSGSVDPSVDNMLKVTSDGRKLGLDQRLINPLLPDDPNSKVNACVKNVHRIWQNGQADRLTQLIFCDISTPKAASAPAALTAKATPSQINGVAVPDDGFNIYDDIRSKLIVRGVPPEEIAFIHDANTEIKKKELFAKVRSGQVRVLMGSTAKMGAGTNVQDRLVALHDVDCPWRPGDLEQRAGRIVRQGNMNPEVQIFRYVTEGTFDAYLWQTVENKQKFISQIMTSKSPVRSCEDVDETALSYAEIKALCAGDPRIKEKMDLDVDVARLRLMKADHQSKQFRLEDQLLRYFPQEIEKNNGSIAGFQKDLETLAAHPLPEKNFVGMEVRGDHLTDRDNAGAAILEACKDAVADKTMLLGSYRGFKMTLDYEPFGNQYILTLRGEMSHRVDLGTDARGNLTRIENVLSGITGRMEACRAQTDNLRQQMAAAKLEVGTPFPQEAELREKSARLAELDAELNMDKPAAPVQPEKQARPSVLDGLKATPAHTTISKAHRKEMEAR